MAPQSISWLTLEKGTTAFGSDGEEIGKVAEVLGDRQKDIFSGVAVRPGLLSSKRFVPAELIENITTDGLTVALPSTEAEARLEPYS